jgi:hypothetical protein
MIGGKRLRRKALKPSPQKIERYYLRNESVDMSFKGRM